MTTEAMFSTIAERYDRCNHLFSLGVDRYWRKHLAQALGPAAGDTALDICCGTGDMAFALLRHTPVRQVTALDCSERMIQRARQKRTRLDRHRWMGGKTLGLEVQDAAALSLEDARFSAVTCAFGLRNIADRAAALGQLHRVLKPGGRLGILEFSLPAGRIRRGLYSVYLSGLMPLAGRVVLGSAEPLRYLARSITRWHQTVCLADELADAGFVEIRSRPLTGGIVTMTVARRPSRQTPLCNKALS